MADALETEYADTLEVENDPKSSARVLAAIKKAERALNDWQALCDRIDDIYSRRELYSEDWIDPDYDLFWASMEIMKPAVYARPPVPVVSPQFKDRRKLQNVTAELLERSVISGFDRTCIDEAMCCTRDDLIFYNRGQLWLTYETDEKGGGQRVVVDHVDRKDFLHPPARKWSEVPWVAKRAWMTKSEMRKRFRKTSGDAYMDAKLATPSPQQRDDDGGADHSKKAGVWEVWHKRDNRVYWVAEGVSVMLDEGEPHLKLRGFFPCPRPAYGTLRPRTLVPVPDYLRYAGHFKKIDSLTRRIYALLDMVRMKGLIPAGGDVGDTVEELLRNDSDTAMLVPVPQAALTSGTGDFVQWMPLAELAQAIQGLIEARRELFSDYDRLSGISDIMRGETEADETLGAQQLKSQYGSVRVREKIDELQRIARDVTQIAAEIMADNFSRDTLLEMSQMEIPTKDDIEKRVQEIENAAEEEMNKLGEQARQAMQQAQQSGQQPDPNQTKQQLQQAQQQIVGKYGPMLKEASEQVPIEDVMDLLRNDKARGFAFEVATDSTILTDELQEKQQRNEFLTVFTGASRGLIALAGMGEPAAKLAGEVLKFVLQPYRVGRELNSVIDEFIDSAPQMAQAVQGGEGGEAEKAIAEANAKIAEAELGKAQAAIKKVDADTQLKTFELQQKQQAAAVEAQQDRERFQLEIADTQGKLKETAARIDKIMAEIRKMGVDAQNQTRKEDREDFKATTEVQMRATDQAMQAENAEREAAFRAQDGQRADRQQDFTERSSDRQMSLAERQAEREGAE
ncbi:MULTISPECIES: hypothetical protein [Chelativorans]|uniref:Portal protein n=1 Tax=Chelativorans sp. (strain BNC1) TaxID=266779 RepID=Q11LU6_CHESB|nr:MULTISPECIES: hypothetical protein [Chelativorans]